MSMQNVSVMNFTTLGGSTRVVGVMPSSLSLSWCGAHHLISVFTVTPARSASCCFVIAFILLFDYLTIYYLTIFQSGSNLSLITHHYSLITIHFSLGL